MQQSQAFDNRTQWHGRTLLLRVAKRWRPSKQLTRTKPPESLVVASHLPCDQLGSIFLMSCSPVGQTFFPSVCRERQLPNAISDARINPPSISGDPQPSPVSRHLTVCAGHQRCFDCPEGSNACVQCSRREKKAFMRKRSRRVGHHELEDMLKTASRTLPHTTQLAKSKSGPNPRNGGLPVSTWKLCHQRRPRASETPKGAPFCVGSYPSRTISRGDGPSGCSVSTVNTFNAKHSPPS